MCWFINWGFGCAFFFRESVDFFNCLFVNEIFRLRFLNSNFNFKILWSMACIYEPCKINGFVLIVKLVVVAIAK